MADGLLFLHAWPLDGTMWEPQARPLRHDVAVVAPSYPGFGGTVPTGRRILTMDEAAEACVDLAIREGVDRFVVCGTSMGGYVAFSIWRRHRERVLGMVLANTRAVADGEDARQRRLDLAERLSFEGSEFLLADPPPLLSSHADPEVRERVESMMRTQPAGAIASASRGMAHRPDSTPDLAGIEVPTLVVTSSEDELIPPSATAPMADAIPGARLAVIERAGHLSSMEAPEEFLGLLHDHAERCGLL